MVIKIKRKDITNLEDTTIVEFKVKGPKKTELNRIINNIIISE